MGKQLTILPTKIFLQLEELALDNDAPNISQGRFAQFVAELTLAKSNQHVYAQAIGKQFAPSHNSALNSDDEKQPE